MCDHLNMISGLPEIVETGAIAARQIWCVLKLPSGDKPLSPSEHHSKGGVMVLRLWLAAEFGGFSS